MIELSRRFSNGLWNCIQVSGVATTYFICFHCFKICNFCNFKLKFWVCCGCTLAIINTICACLALPPILTPFTSVYLMCIIVPILATTLVKIEADPEIMNRATAKKHSSFDSKVFAYVTCSYGCKFLPTIIVMVRVFFSLLLSISFIFTNRFFRIIYW